MTMGHCKHGEFELTKGCPDCIQEAREAREAEALREKVPEELSEEEVAAAEMEAEAAADQEPEPIIVKVRYLSETAGEVSGREYAYFSAEVLKVGDVVQVPVRDRVQKAVVTAIDVPESEIADFRLDVKTIPAGSTFPGAQAPTLFDQVPPEEAAVAEPEPILTAQCAEGRHELCLGDLPGDDWTKPSKCECECHKEPEPVPAAEVAAPTETKPPALVVIETQVGLPANELFQLYQEAASLLRVAKKRVIATNEDLKPATDDLAIIAVCKKAMFARKTELVEPFKTRLDTINQAFADLMFPVLEADRLTRGQVTIFDNEQRRKAAEAQRIEDEKLRLAKEEAALTGTGEHTQELGTAVAPPPVPEHTRTDLGTLGGRTNWKARVVDFALLPDEYKLPNEPLLNNFARSTKGTRPIPGVEFYDDRVVTMRTR